MRVILFVLFLFLNCNENIHKPLPLLLREVGFSRVFALVLRSPAPGSLLSSPLFSVRVHVQPSSCAISQGCLACVAG